MLEVASKAVYQRSPPGREKPPKDSPIPVYVITPLKYVFIILTQCIQSQYKLQNTNCLGIHMTCQ